MSDEDESSNYSSLRIAVVGPCASGKSTLVGALQKMGYKVHHVAQEHSYVPYMWQHITKPDVLIYLDLDYDTMKARRPHNCGPPRALVEQHKRLSHARQHCHLYLDTTSLSPAQVQAQVLNFLQNLPAEDTN